MSRQDRPLWLRTPLEQAEIYVAAAGALLLVVVLLWRLVQRRVGLAQSLAPALLLLVGGVPVLGTIEVETSIFIALIGLFVLPQLGVLLVWIVGDAEIREARPGSVEHWDRLVRLRPVRATGAAILTGLGFGCILSGLISASGRIADLFGGGYGAFLLTLPDYWLLPTTISRGVALAAGTAFLVGLGGRLLGRPGAIVGAALAGIGWSILIPVVPIQHAWTLGVVASLAAGWVAWHHGLLPLTIACLTGLSLPVAWLAWSHSPMLRPVAIVSCLPFLLLPLGLALVRWAPKRHAVAPVQPAFVANLAQQARLKGEVELLQKLQLSLLPEEDWASANGVDAAWRMVPAEDVGGDFLDLVEDEAGRLWIAVADAAGHGISCSVLTAFAKAAVNEHASAGTTPQQALTRIRRLFGRLRVRRSMVTMLLATWDPQTHRLSVATAGHPPLLVCCNNDVREVGHPCRPLGVELPGEDVEATVDVPPGSLVVAYSDGVCEALSPRGEAFGYDRWQRMLSKGIDDSAESILTRLLEAVDSHRAGRPATDDTTAVVVRLG